MAWRLFHRILLLFLGLGVSPLLGVVIVLSLPLDLPWHDYKMLLGLFLIISTGSALLLAAAVTRHVKRPIRRLIEAQKAIQGGDLAYRLPLTGSVEMRTLFDGFNRMAVGIGRTVDREKALAAQCAVARCATKLAHDLRSPIAALTVATGIIAKSGEGKASPADLLEPFRRSTQRLSQIADALLTEGRPDEMTAPADGERNR